MDLLMDPIEIERKSFEIITEKLKGRQFDQENLNVIKRVIHTTADFDYADNLTFSQGAVSIAKDALKRGTKIITDTQMVKSGINKKATAQLGCEVHCYISEPSIAEAAQKKGFTRARASVDHAIESFNKDPLIFVVGNAPTALIRLHEWISKHNYSPSFIIAVPVGFVNVIESKELISTLNTPHIIAKGQKGGSNVAAAICNALLYEIIND